MTKPPRRLSRQLPPGVRDIFGAPARQLTGLSAMLHDLFDGWGYSQVRPPTFEYFDNVMRAFDDDFAARIYRFVDPDGHLLALRPDLTVPVARLVANTLYDQPMPQRLSYVAPVFRFSEPNSNQSSQVWQGGWELIGVASAAADAEVIALLITALEKLGLQEFQVNLGHMGFVQAILADLKVDQPVLETILRAVDRKNQQILLQTLKEAKVNGELQAALSALPELWGGQEVLQTALTLAPNDRARDAIGYLQEVLGLLEGYGVAEHVTIDLGEVRGMDYYTGIMFEAFATGSGFAIASGGRYDHLLARFGADLPAVGAMIELERVMKVLNQSNPLPSEPLPDALQQQCDHPTCLQTLLQGRLQGKRIQLDLTGRNLAQLHAEAAQRGIAQVIACEQP
ncbi:MAG: ATP phosphoribosyltransferase regulatory subunit [Ardenticatenaceae bacterium]